MVNKIEGGDPYQRVVDEFNRKGVRYVVVGMSGINYYARNPSEMFATMDYDIFLDPTLANVKKAVVNLEALGFSLGTAQGKLEAASLARLVKEQRTLVATTPDGVMIELLLKVSGYPFSDLAKDAATFTVDQIPVKVGRLEKLLRSKEIAGRPKDRQFLKRYKNLLDIG
ncbi:MAG: hypothetical protein HYY14_07135 [Candidatus Omnitrophica bacterium]|nr:hypothetical protein [Candidatus Omnitrophota bacterium]